MQVGDRHLRPGHGQVRGGRPVARGASPLNQCIGREIAALVQKGNKADSWQDVAADVKKNLVGTIRPIDVPVKVPNGTGEEDYEWKFEPLLDNEGKPVVRAITEADIDRLGEACMETILFG